MLDALIVLYVTLVTPVLSWVVIRRDMRRLAPAALARTWNDASCLSAVVLFGPLAVLVHFVKARRWLRGFPLGLAWAVAVHLVVSVPLVILDALLGASAAH